MKKLIVTDPVWICGSDLIGSDIQNFRWEAWMYGIWQYPPFRANPWKAKNRRSGPDKECENRWRRMMVVLLSSDFHRYTNVKASQVIPTPHLLTHASLTWKMSGNNSGAQKSAKARLEELRQQILDVEEAARMEEEALRAQEAERWRRGMMSGWGLDLMWALQCSSGREI